MIKAVDIKAEVAGLWVLERRRTATPEAEARRTGTGSRARAWSRC